MNFGIYIGGLLLLIGALSYALAQAGLPLEWVAVAAIAVLGIGVMIAVGKTDPGEQESSETS